MTLPTLRYHLRRMWARFRFSDVVDNGKGKWLFKFKNEKGMSSVLDQSPWIVELAINKPKASMRKTELVK